MCNPPLEAVRPLHPAPGPLTITLSAASAAAVICSLTGALRYHTADGRSTRGACWRHRCPHLLAPQVLPAHARTYGNQLNNNRIAHEGTHSILRPVAAARMLSGPPGCRKHSDSRISAIGVCALPGPCRLATLRPLTHKEARSCRGDAARRGNAHAEDAAVVDTGHLRLPGQLTGTAQRPLHLCTFSRRELQKAATGRRLVRSACRDGASR